MNPYPGRLSVARKALPSRMFWVFLVGTFVCALAGDDVSPISAPNSELMRNVQLLRLIDLGDLTSARRWLNDDSMSRIFAILNTVEFTTNADVLFSQPGLRAAAKYWTNLPTNVVSVPISEPTVSNAIYSALDAVRKDLRMKRYPLPDQDRRQSGRGSTHN